MLTFHIISLFPESFDSYLKSSIIGRAVKNKKIKIKFYNPRDFVRGSKTGYKRVDEKPYGGGPGMVLRAGPILRALAKISRSLPGKKGKSQSRNLARAIFLTPDGRQFDNKLAESWAKKLRHLILICGRYEGIDERVAKISGAQKVSVGPYILTGGELPAMVIMDTTARQIRGVLGKTDSLEESRASSHAVYTRPGVLRHQGKNYRVPRVLLSGNHKKVDEWREGK